LSPVFNRIPKIVDQTFRAHESIWLLLFANIPVIAFAGLVVKTKHANAINHVSEAVLEFVRTAADKGWNAPDHDFSEATLPKDASFPQQQDCSRVGDFTNTIRSIKAENRADSRPSGVRR
jgi:hypothetical protein